MIDRKELELLVRAQIQGGKDLDAVAKSIANIGDAIKEQSDAAKRGESRIDELKGSLEALALVQKELQGQASAVAYFQKLSATIGKSEANVKKATDRYTEYSKKLDEAGERTEKQQQTLIRYSLAVEKANKSLDSQRSTLASMEKEFRDAGIAVENLAAVQQRNLTLQAELGLVYNRGKESIKSYAAEVRKARDEQAKLDKANADSARNAQLFEQAERRAADAAAARARAAAEVAQARDNRNAEVAGARRLASEQEQELRRGRELAALRQDIIQRSERQTQANLEAARTAQLFEQAERRAADAASARARAAAEVEQSRGNRNAEVAANRRLDAEETERIKRAQQLAALRKDIVDRSATQALVEQADAATKTARSYTTLARAADTLRPKSVSLRDSISQIINPAAQARASLGGLEQEVGELAASVGKIKGPVQDYRGQMDQLLAAQKALGQQASLVDTFNRQVLALRTARAEFVKARADVATYAAGIAQGGDAGAQFAAKLAQAQNQLRGSAAALAQQVQATRESREALRTAGIASNDLATSQRRLNDVARQTVTTMQGLDAATEKYGQSVEKAKRSKIGFRDEGRTTLSYIQRLRGEVLSLVAAYGGLFTVINTARGAIQATQTREGARNQLSISAGTDREAIDADYEYVKAQSDRIGIEFEGAIKNYAKFAASAKLAGRAREEYRYIFETFSEVGRVANLSADNIEGVFKALEQSFSKGKIQAEELRGQLGDRLFGAFQVAARALQGQFPDLDKALKEGKVSSEQLIVIAKEYRKVVAEQLGPATQSLAAQQARLSNAVFDFQLAVGDSGFINSYSEALQKLTRFLGSEDGKKFAQSVGTAFKVLTDVFIVLLDNLDLVLAAMQLFLVYFTYTRFASGIKGVGGAVASFEELTKTVTFSLDSLKNFVKAIPALFAAFSTGFAIGNWAHNEFEIVRAAGTYLVTAMFKAWAVIKASFQAAVETFPVLIREVFEKVVSLVKTAAKNIVGIFASIAEAVGLDGLGAALRGVESKINTAFSGFGKSAGMVSTFRQNLEKELSEINRIRDEMLNDDQGRNVRKGVGSSKAAAATTPYPGKTGPGKNSGGPTEAEIRKRENEIEAITKALEALDAKIDRSQTETLQKQLDAIDSQYAALARRIEKLGGDTGKVFMARLTETIQELRTVTINKFNDDLKKETDAFLKKTGDAEEQAGKRQRLDLQARLGAIVSDYEQLYKELADLRLKYVQNNRDTGELDATRQRLNVAKELRLEQETIKFNTEELNRREQLLNDTIAARDKLLAAVNTQREVGAIDDVEAAKQLNAIQDQYVPKIVQAYETTRLWAIENDKIFANEEQRAVFLATLDAIKAKATGVKTEFSLLNNTIIQGGVKAVDTGLNAIADGLTNIATGQSTVADGFRGMIAGFAQFAAAFLRDIAIMIIKLQFFKMLQGMGGYAGAIGAAGQASMGVKHSGGVIGHYSSGNRTRDVSPSWFANAPRYHSGGVMGLASDEYPTILQRGEEVLSADSPRNIMNGGGMPQSGGGEAGTRIVLVDDRARVPEAMNSPDGERVIMAAVKANVSTLKQWVR